MSAGQKSGTGAMVELEDEKVRKNDILSNRDKAQRRPGQSLDGRGVQVDEYKDTPTNRRPKADDRLKHEVKSKSKHSTKQPSKTATPKSGDASQQVDRPGFDLGGSTGTTRAGKGLGLGADAKKNQKGWRLPR
jgi:hypothetical protein